MTKQVYSRDEVKALLREAIQRKRSDAEPVTTESKPVEDNKSEKTYTCEEVEALIRKDRETRKV